MLQKNTKLISETVDPGRLYQTLLEVTTFHRIQGSPTFRAAAQHVCDKLNRQGISAEVLSFPADEDTIFDTYPSFQEWSCKGAYCDIVEPFYRRIADFDRNNTSIIQKSIGCDYRDKPLEIVMLDKGTSPEAYEGVDFEGKLVFVREDMNKIYSWAIEEKGAVGIITDFVLHGEFVRDRYDQLDTLRYTSFWWQKGQKKSFGFVLTPREGDKLAAAIKEAEAKGETVKINCFIDAELYNGSIEDVTAFIPGETEEEILITAHLCHPRASANDNASGVSAAMESIRAIKDLVEAGKLPPLKRGIRILLIPEFTGTYAYLDRIQDERKKILAGFNLDMVGGKQNDGYGPITITDLPKASPSFVGDLAMFVLEEIKQEAPVHGGGKNVPMFNSAFGSFSGGSDHQVLTDPCVGIPALMLGQWPDKFYHTSSDTVDMVDPHILSKSSSIAAAYAYALATLSVEDVPQIMNTAMTRLVSDLGELITDKYVGKIDEAAFKKMAFRRCQYAIECNEDYKRYFKGEELQQVTAIIEAEAKHITAVGTALTGFDVTEKPASSLTDEEKKALSYVPVRTHFTPVQTRQLTYTFTPEQKKANDEFSAKYMKRLGWGTSSIVMYYVDGKRTAAEICEVLELDNGSVDVEAVAKYLDLMETLGFVIKK